MPHRLRIFISSTADLKAERDAVESVLAEMDIDGERFESWPSSPNHPIAECLQRLDESDAVILLLGGKYGTPSPVKSGTHLEYDHAVSKGPSKPLFAYLLAASECEPKQQEFINVVFTSRFRGRQISEIEVLKIQIKRSLRDEFVRRFRAFQEPPLTTTSFQTMELDLEARPTITLDDDPRKALRQLEALYNQRQDASIHKLASECRSKFSSDPEIMNMLYMAQVNLAMQGVRIDPKELLEAVAFWDTAEAKKRWAREGLNYNQGNALGALGLQTEAISRYKAALAINGSVAQCWVNLGNSHSACGNIPAASECFEKALSFEPNLFQALYSSATVAIRHKRDFDAALMFLNRIAISQLPMQYRAAVHAWKANALLKLDRYAEGIAEAEDAIACALNSKWTWGVAARLYALARHSDKKWLTAALDFWQRYLQKYPDNAKAWAEMGFVCWFLRQSKDKAKLSQRALTAFLKAIELGLTEEALIYDRTGHLYQDQNDWPEAEKFYRKACSLNLPQFGYCLGVVLMLQDKHLEALPLLMAAAEQHQPDAMSWHELAICYERAGKTNNTYLPKAEAAYKKAIEIDPCYATAWFNLGGYYWNQHDMAGAISIWQTAMQKFPDHPDCNKVKALFAS